MKAKLFSAKISPTRIRVEASSVCQLRCPVCPTGQGQMRESACGSGVLKFEDFKKLLDRNSSIREVELSNWGEVFLNRDLPKILEYAHKVNVKVTISNGANLNHASEAALCALVTNQVEELVVALDGASDETYKKYRVRGNFNDVIANVKAINALKKRHQSEKPRLIWQFIVFGHNEHEINAAKTLAKELGMTFAPKLNAVPDYSPIKNVGKVLADTGLPTARVRADWGRAMCNQLWLSPQVNWDGKIMGCCHNNWKDFGGNAFEDDLKQCLNNEKIAYARKMLTGEAPPRDGIACASCEFYSAMSKQRMWVNSPRMQITMLVNRLFPSVRSVYRQLRRRYTGIRKSPIAYSSTT